MKTFIPILVVIAFLGVLAWGDGTVTIREFTKVGTVKQVTWQWTTNTAGGAVCSSTEYYDGKILQCITIPSATPYIPSDAYDIIISATFSEPPILTTNSIDLLCGNGYNRSATFTQFIDEATQALGVAASNRLVLRVTNAGSETKGTVHLYIR